MKEEEVKDNRIIISNDELMYDSNKTSDNECNNYTNNNLESSIDDNLEKYDLMSNDEDPPDGTNDNTVDGGPGSKLRYEISSYL